jgi:hypothetical protein
MKKTLALVLLLVLVGSVVVSGQGITYDTGFQVQNLGTAQANITVTYYNQDGSVAASVADTIAAGGSKTYYPLTAVPDGFNGSVVITSDQPVAAIANELGNAGAYGASYAGFSAGATEVNLPLIMRANGGFDTWFNVQNAGTADANVTVTYTPGAHGTPYTEMATIKPGAAHTFDQAGLTALGTRFVGSAKVTSNQPVVATCNQVGPTTLLAYDGFTGGSMMPSFPLVNALNAGYVTGIQIMNIGTASTDVTVSYTPSIAGAPSSETQSIAAGASATFALRHFTARFVGSGAVTVNSASQPLVAVVNQLNTGANKGAAYGGFDPATATDKVSFPLAMANNPTPGAYYTATTVQNVGTTTTTVTISYSGSTATQSQTLAPGESWPVAQTTHFAGRYVGSATVTASGGGLIIGMCNELNPMVGGDAFLVYEGFNY